MKKHQCVCNDCGLTFFLDDVDWCIHKQTLGTGTKECPQCHSCICHGETVEEIQARFDRNISVGKFVKTNNELTEKFGWQYQCKTIKEVEV